MAPTAAQIRAEVLALGWRVKRPPGAWPRRKGEKTSAQALKRMQRAVIAYRLRGLLSVSAGWLPAAAGLRGSGKKELKNIKHPRGRVEFVNFNGDTPGILIANGMPGAVYVQEKHDVLGTALHAVAADLETYNARKLNEAAREAGFR